MQAQPGIERFRPELAALQANHAPRNRQTQAKPITTGSGRIEASERLKDKLQLVRCHAGAAVLDPQVPASFLSLASQPHAAFNRRMTDGIAQDVLQCLGQAVQVGANPAVFRQVARQPRRAPAGFETGVVAQYVPQRADIDRFARYLSLRVVLEAPPEAYGPRLFSLGAGHDRLVVRQT